VSTKAQANTRLHFVDQLRGLAVIFMIPLHTSHGWVDPSVRNGNIWHAIQFFGGLAAPIFLTLAGASLGMRWAIDGTRGRTPRYLDDLSRALQIVVLGYALRLQMWVVDGAGFTQSASYPAQLLLLGAYTLAYGALGVLPVQPRRALLGVTAAAGLFALGLAQVSATAPARLMGLLRVDVLQCIGGSLALVTALGAARGRAFAKPALYVALGAAVAITASWTRSWVPGPLPPALAGYLGQWKPATGQSIVGLFPLFPWLAYTLVGTTFGLMWARADARGRTQTMVVSLAAIGALLALLSSESLPHVFHSFAAQPWLTQPVRVLHRLGLVLVLAGAALALGHARSPIRAPLEVLGRTSLLVYWVHLEFAFGAFSEPFAKRLSLMDWAIGSALLVVSMTLLAYARVTVPDLRARQTREALR
jgi:uncharacterized membrane protein